MINTIPTVRCSPRFPAKDESGTQEHGDTQIVPDVGRWFFRNQVTAHCAGDRACRSNRNYRLAIRRYFDLVAVDQLQTLGLKRALLWRHLG